MKWIKDFIDGDHIIGQLLVVSATKGTTDKGLSYLNVTFQDKTGSIEAKKWDASDEDLRTLVPGSVVIVDGLVNLYKNQPQLKIVGVSKLDNPKEVDMSNFARVSPIPLEELKAKLDKYLNSFKDKDVEKITKAVISHFYDRYITFPGAVKVHHEFGSGIYITHYLWQMSLTL